MSRSDSNNIFLIDGVRTPIGSLFKGFKSVSAVELAAATLREIVRRPTLNPVWVDQVIMGNAVSAGTGQNLSRQATVASGLPVSTPAFTVNHVCGSGLQSVVLATQAIKAGDCRLIIAGGTENSSQNPFIVRRYHSEKITTSDLKDSLVLDGLWCEMTDAHMGELAEFLAEEYHITRGQQDQYALESHHKACLAQEANKFAGEIVGILLKGGEILKRDERPRKNIDLEKLMHLPPAFKKEGGTVTAGNSCIPCDGAGCVVVASAPAVKEYKLKPQARILGYASVAVAPKLVFTAAIPAIRACLKKCGLSLKDIDLFEISESFAVQSIVTQSQLKIPEGKMNIFGGDVALGHPLGAAGTRILVTLLHALADQKKKIGLAAVCLGGGGAVAMAIERV